jgi:hypothetical protein
MKSMYTIIAGVAFATLALAATGCDGRAILAGNLALSAVPCVLLYLTVNLKKD